jgi:hypothetical protein
MLQIIEALQASLNDYNESSAGFVFEGFMAALTGGRQEAGRVGGTLPIEDFITGDNENVSLKLLSPNTPIHGSFTNLIDYLFIRGETGVPSIKYLIAFKNSEEDTVAELALWDFEINRDNVVDIMLLSNNGGRLGPVAEKLKQHMQSFADTPEWKLRMAELLQHAPGYNNKRGMFFKNVTDGGEFEIRADAVPDPNIKRNQFNLMLKAGELNKLKGLAKREGALAAENGTSFEEWMEELDLDALPPKLKSGAAGAKRTKALSDIENSFRRGYQQAVAKAEQSDEIVTESYFGSFHEDEKRHLQEELLSEAKGAGDAKSQFSISRGDMSKIEPVANTQFYGTINLGQGNIDALTKIYVEKIGADLMALLENTKNFADNIGRYFSADDRSVAVQNKNQAIAQGGQIISSLVADPASPDSAE